MRSLSLLLVPVLLAMLPGCGDPLAERAELVTRIELVDEECSRLEVITVQVAALEAALAAWRTSLRVDIPRLHEVDGCAPCGDLLAARAEPVLSWTMEAQDPIRPDFEDPAAKTDARAALEERVELLETYRDGLRRRAETLDRSELRLQAALDSEKVYAEAVCVEPDCRARAAAARGY